MTPCIKCGREDETVFRILRCPACLKFICESCAIRYNGRYFCSHECSVTFYWDYGDDE